MKAALEKMAVARRIVVLRAPYIATTLYSLIPFPVPDLRKKLNGKAGIGTTKKMVMAFDPEWFLSLTDEQAASELFHETQHPIRRHFERSAYFPDPEQFNIAGDLPINEDMKTMGFEIGEDWYLPATYGFPVGLSAEEYYELFEQLKQQQQQQPSPAPKPQSAGGAGEQSPQQDSPPNPSPGKPSNNPGKNHNRCCGSMSGNSLPDEELYEQMVETESPGATKSESDVKSILNDQAREIANFVASQGRGNIPNHLVEWAKFAIRPPKVPWRKQLPRIIRRVTGLVKAGGENYSKARPSKRSFVRGTIIPGIVSHKPELAFIRDTSGSMGKKQLKDAQNEAVGILKAIGIERVWFLDADASAGKPKRVSVRDIPKLPITGRGGTDFAPALELVARLRPRPKAVFYFTDGDGYAPPKPPAGMEVVWVIVGSYYNKAPCNWGHQVFVRDDNDVEMDEL